MFRDAKALDRQITASSFGQALTRYSSKAEKWFDGSVDSIDSRLAACTRLLHQASFTVARVSINDAARYLVAAESLESDRRALEGMREDLLTGGMNRQDMVGPPGWSRSAGQLSDEPFQYNSSEPPPDDRGSHGTSFEPGMIQEINKKGYDPEANYDRRTEQARGYARDQEALSPYDDSEDEDNSPAPPARPQWHGEQDDMRQRNQQVVDQRSRFQDEQRRQTVAPSTKPPVEQPIPRQGPFDRSLPKTDPRGVGPSQEPRPGPVAPPNRLRQVDPSASPDLESQNHWRGDQNTTYSPDGVKGQMSLFNDSPAEELPSLNKYISPPPPPRRARLASADARWVTLESAKFVAANSAVTNDSFELATRAHEHAAMKTSTFTPQRSAEVCRAFVATVTELGQRSRSSRRTAAVAPIDIDFDPQAMFL